MPNARRVLAALIVTVSLFSQASSPRAAQNAGLALQQRNFDVRTEKDTASDAYMERFSARPSFSAVAVLARSQDLGVARLQTTFNADVLLNPELGTPEVVSAKPGTGFLSGPSANRAASMRAFLSAHADAYGLTPDQIQNLVLVADYENPAGNMAWVELEQRINGLPVFRGLIRGGFTARGELARTTGPLAAGLLGALLPVSPTLSAAQAVARAAAHVGWNATADSLTQLAVQGEIVTFARGTMASEAKAWRLYFPLAPGVARLAWATEIWGDRDAFLILLDAQDGTVLFRKNLTEYQSQTATYSIYNDDSPAPQSPTTALPGSAFQAPYIARSNITLVGNEPPNTFNNLGWMTDGTNVTDGNNVEAGIDRNGIDGVDATVSSVNRVFDFSYDPSATEPLTPLYQNGEVTDTFYWTNLYHDRLYLLGFTEAARNFQHDNFGRGGIAGDRISAESQDSSGTNNANFSTPSDGGRGRMQMYIFPSPVPDRTSGLEHDVLIHELTHGTSNRLHSNAGGLTSTMSRGMGEGWSDFYARALLSTAAEDPNGVYASGGWLTYQLSSGYTDNYYYGIRRFPYAVMSTVGANGKPHNPLTFADIDPAQINTSDGAHPGSPIIPNTAFQVHNIGEVWCMALLEVRARFIARLGFGIGNQRFLQFVTDGMKLDPVNPTFLQGRDSILTAANAGGGTPADIADIWAGFAIRGMGISAQVLNASTGAVVEAFDAPGILAGAGTLITESSPNGRLDPGEAATVSLCIANNGFAASGNVTATLLAGGGVTSPSGPQSYGQIAAGGTQCRSYTFTVGPICLASVTATLEAQESGGATRNLTYGFPMGSLSTFFSQDFDGVTAPALPGGWTTSTLTGTTNPWVTSTTSFHTAPNRVFASNLNTVSDSVLISPAIAVPSGSSQLTFQHLYNLESSFDGGVLEIAINGGPFQDILTAGGSFVSGGYNGAISNSFGNPIGGRSAWTGNSGTYITTTITLPTAASGQKAAARCKCVISESRLSWISVKYS